LDACNDDGKVAAIFEKLPVVTQKVLQYLSNFICLMGDPKHVAHTKMEIAGLCIVFVPATLKNPVFDCKLLFVKIFDLFLYLQKKKKKDASAIRNQSVEQAFMQRLVLWIRSRFPDDCVGGFNPPAVAPSSAAKKSPSTIRPQRRAPVAPATPIPSAATPPAMLKKRGSTVAEDLSAIRGGSPGKTRKTGKNVSPASTQRAALSPVQP
jgi:hypothetical protein